MSRRSTTDIWMPLYFAEFDKAVSRLSMVEECAFGRLQRDYWLNGSPPDNDDTLACIVGVKRREWLKLRPALERLFSIEDGHWVDSHLDKARAHAREVSEKRQAAGLQGGRPPNQLRKQPESKRKPNGSPEQKQTETHARLHVPYPDTPENPIQRVSSDSQDEAQAKANIIPLDGRAGR